jgi:hypothetical protein
MIRFPASPVCLQAACADDISDDNADDSRARLHPQLHHTSASIMPGHAIRPCLRISRLGVRISSGARGSEALSGIVEAPLLVV